MKKRILLSTMMVLVMAVSSAAFAENPVSGDVELTDRWNFGVSASGVIPDNSRDYDPGYNIQGSLSYDLFQWLAVGGEVGYTAVDGFICSEDVEEVTGLKNVLMTTDRLKAWNLHSYPLMGNIILKAPIKMDNGKLVPYITNGFGVLLSNADVTVQLKSGGSRYDIDLTVEPAFLCKLGAGLDFYMGDSLALMFETSYQWADLDYHIKVPKYSSTTYKHTQNFDSCYIGGGLKLRF